MRPALIALLALACGDTDGPRDGPNSAADASAPDASVPDAPADTAGVDSWVGFACGPATCAPGTGCCYGKDIALCLDASEPCGGLLVQCDGPEDCLEVGRVCCAGRCAPRGDPCTVGILCHEDADCASPPVCCPTGVCGPC